MKLPSDEVVERSVRKLRTSARIWTRHGGAHPAQAFTEVADYLEYLMRGRRKGKKGHK